MYNHYDPWCAYWRSQVLVSARKLAELAEIHCGFLQFFPNTSLEKSQIRARRLSCAAISINSLSSHLKFYAYGQKY